MVLYGDKFAGQLARMFVDDLQRAQRVTALRKKQPWHKRLIEATARLLSPLL